MADANFQRADRFSGCFLLRFFYIFTEFWFKRANIFKYRTRVLKKNYKNITTIKHILFKEYVFALISLSFIFYINMSVKTHFKLLS